MVCCAPAHCRQASFAFVLVCVHLHARSLTCLLVRIKYNYSRSSACPISDESFKSSATARTGQYLAETPESADAICRCMLAGCSKREIVQSTPIQARQGQARNGWSVCAHLRSARDQQRFLEGFWISCAGHLHLVALATHLYLCSHITLFHVVLKCRYAHHTRYKCSGCWRDILCRGITQLLRT